MRRSQKTPQKARIKRAFDFKKIFDWNLLVDNLNDETGSTEDKETTTIVFCNIAFQYWYNIAQCTRWIKRLKTWQLHHRVHWSHPGLWWWWMLTRLSWLCPIPVIKCSHSKHTYSYIDQDWRLLLLLKIIFATSLKYAGKIQRNTVEISKKSDHWNMLDKFGEILLKNPKKCYWLLEQIQLKFGDVALLFLPLCCTRGQVLRYDCDNL